MSTEAFCVATARVSNSSALALSQIKLAATDMFIAQLSHVFGDDLEPSYKWLCQVRFLNTTIYLDFTNTVPELQLHRHQ